MVERRIGRRRIGKRRAFGAGLAAFLASAAPSARAADVEQAPGQASALQVDPWQFTLGAGIGVLPRYEGADRSRLVPIPFASVTYDHRVTLSPEGLAVTALSYRGFTLTPILGYGGGRKASQDSSLKGLGDIQSAVTAGLAMQYQNGPFSVAVKSRQAVTQSRDGFQADIEAKYALHLTSRFEIEAGPEMTLVDGRYAKTYFGVDAAQAARSGKPIHLAGGGLKDVGLGVQAIYHLSDDWSLVARAADHRLLGDFADSPVTRSKNQAMLATGIVYRF